MNFKKVKYPRTLHLPWSESVTCDDRVMTTVDSFHKIEVVVTEKMDGENTTLYRGGIHARSLDSRGHESRDWVKNLWSSVSFNIPKGWRICGENLYARHSVEYDNLKSYFYGFSIWDDGNVCIGWDDTVEWFSRLGIDCVPILYRGEFDEDKIKSLFCNERRNKSEGYVVRVVDPFEYNDFSKCVGKFVRKNHVQTNQHWMHGEIRKNGIKRPL